MKIKLKIKPHKTLAIDPLTLLDIAKAIDEGKKKIKNAQQEN